MAIGDVYLAQIVCTAPDSQIAVNARHWVVTAQAGTGATDTQIAAVISNQIAGSYKALLCNASLYYGVKVNKIWPLPISVGGSDRTGNGVGTAGVNQLPLQVSGLLTIRTAFGGRANRGRVYVPFPSTTDSQATGEPTAGYVGRLTALVTTLFPAPLTAGVGGNTTTFGPTLYHRATHLVTPITVVQSSTKWATQRRRGLYGQPNVVPF